MTLVRAFEKGSDVYNSIQRYKEGINGLIIQVSNISAVKKRLVAKKVEIINTGSNKSLLLFLREYTCS